MAGFFTEEIPPQGRLPIKALSPAAENGPAICLFSGQL
jgi:hypothetical protein